MSRERSMLYMETHKLYYDIMVWFSFLIGTKRNSLDDNRKSNNFCFKHERNTKDKLQSIPNAGRTYISSGKYERDDDSNQVKYKNNVPGRVIRQKNDSTELQFNDEQNVNTLRYKYKGRKSTSGNKVKNEINKVREAVTEESYKSSSTDDYVTKKSLIWLLQVRSKNQILDLQNNNTGKNNSVYELQKLDDDKQKNVWLQSDLKKSKNTKNKIKHKNKGNNSKDNGNKKCSKLDNSRTVVDGLSSKGNKYLTSRTSPITTDKSCSSGHVTNVSQYKFETEQTIMKHNNNLSDTISAEEKETIKEKLKTLRPSKYKRFHLILKRIEKKITEDIEKKLRKVLRMPEVKTYFQNTILENTDEKKTISSLMGALMQVIIILESQCIGKRKKSISGSKTDESVDQKQSACYYVTSQKGNSDSNCISNSNKENSTSSASETPEDRTFLNKPLMKISKKHQNREANCKKISSNKLKAQNNILVENDSTYNDIDKHLAKIFHSCISSEMSNYRTVRKYKKKSFENKFNFEFQSMFKDSSSFITQNHNTYSANVITNSNTQFLNTQTKDSLYNKKDLKVLSLLNEIYNTPNITDDKLNKLSLAVLKNIDCCIEKEDIPYIIVEINKLVKYSKDIYDQIYNIYKTVNTLKGDERNIILMQHLFSKSKYNSNCFESAVPGEDNKMSPVLNTAYNTYDTNKTETTHSSVGSEKGTQTTIVLSPLNVRKCQKGNQYCFDQATATVCSNDKHTGIKKTSESVKLKSTLSENDGKLDFTDISPSLPEDTKNLCIPERFDKTQNKNVNIPTVSIETTESAMNNRTKEIDESHFRCGDHKSHIQGTETFSLQNKFPQEKNENVVHKTSDLFDVEMTDDSQNHSSYKPDEIEKNELPTNYFKNSFNIAFSKNYNPKVFNNQTIDFGRWNYGGRVSHTFKRKHEIDSECSAPKRQYIKANQENYFWDFVPQHNSSNDNPLISYQNVHLIRKKNQIYGDSFKNRTVESVPRECNDNFMICSNIKLQNLNDSLGSQSSNYIHSKSHIRKENDMLQIHNKGIYVSHVPKYCKPVNESSYIHQSNPHLICSNVSESNRKQNTLVNKHQKKNETDSSNHNIFSPYPHYRNKEILCNKKKNWMLDDCSRHNCVTFGKEGNGDSESFPHHNNVRESNRIRIRVEDVGNASNDEKLLQNDQHIVNNTHKNSAVQTIHNDLSMEQEISCSFLSGKSNNFQSNNLENTLCDRKMFEGSQIRQNSFICLKDNNKFSKPQILETKIIQKNRHFGNKKAECQKNNVLKHNQIKSEAELCCVSNTSSMDTISGTHEFTNQINVVPTNNMNNSFLLNSCVNNLQDSPNNNGSTQFMVKSNKENTYFRETTVETKEQLNCIKTTIQKNPCPHLKYSDVSLEGCQESHMLDSKTEPPLKNPCPHLKYSDVSLEGCQESHMLDSKTEPPLLVAKDSVIINLKRDECLEITLSRHSQNNVSIQKLAKISEAEFNKANNFKQPEILGHASVSADCVNSTKKVVVDSIEENNPFTRLKINAPHKRTDCEKVGKRIISENDHYYYNSALRHNGDKNEEIKPTEMNEAQNINNYYCLADGQNFNNVFHPSVPPNINKPSYMPLHHCQENRSLIEPNVNKRLFRCTSLPQGPSSLQQHAYCNSKQIQIQKHLPVQQPMFQENRSEKSVFYDSSQSDPVGSSHMKGKNKSKKGMLKINWSTLFSKLFKGMQLKREDN